METPMLTGTLFYCVLFVFISGISSLTTYRSCLDVKHGSNPPNTKDGDYPLLIKNKLVTPIYCADMATSIPKEYLTLRAGPSNNYASVYDNIGSSSVVSACSDARPRQLNPERGRTEYKKVRLNVAQLSVSITDQRFTIQRGPNAIPYATAGDHFTVSPQCIPMGTFKLDLTGSPFVVSQETQWTLNASSPPGTSQKQSIFITNSTYIGCFMDTDERLLPSANFTGDYVTVESCVKFCNSRGFPFAGMQNSSQCFCGDSHDRYPRAESEAECNLPCVGNAKEKCGGVGRISVYDTGYPQAIQGLCGGFPGRCYPALKAKPDQTRLQLTLIPSHPCLQPLSPCKNEGQCEAVGGRAYRCRCFEGFSGFNCEVPNIIYQGLVCPPQYQPETCACDPVSPVQCFGAKFIGDICQTKSGIAKVGCAPSNSSHVSLFNVDGSLGQQSVSCPPGTKLVWCSVWDNDRVRPSWGEADNVRYSSGLCALHHQCLTCTLQARCKKYDCGCKNGGRCHKITGECICKDGYYGTKCETFDYCSFYENEMGYLPCYGAAQCHAVPENGIRAYGGDQRGDHCVFPVSYKGQMYGKCIEENMSSPPFACGSVFDGSREGYIDLGLWSPGYRYTIAAWVRPAAADRTRRTIVGGVGYCRDFGIYNFENFWVYYRGRNWTCTKGVDTTLAIRTGQWYLVAISNNGTHVTGYANNHSVTVEATPYFLPTTASFWIGGEECCPTGRFKGMIKSVKIWNRALSYQEINRSMSTTGSEFSTVEALTGGLVGHYELGENIKPHCIGTDHGGQDWSPRHQSSISGTHCNILLFHIPRDTIVSVTPYNRTTNTGGVLVIDARNIRIEGTLTGNEAGYPGGQPNSRGGQQGDSINGEGVISTKRNRGGGGGGLDGGQMDSGKGQPGGGAGFGTTGSMIGVYRNWSVAGEYGQVYGDGTMSKLLMGSGGGSGGRAKDTSNNPPGGAGGNGGGAIRLQAEMNVIISGKVAVNGGNGGNTVRCVSKCRSSCHALNTSCQDKNVTEECWSQSGAGGGGSGGSIHIIGKVVKLGQLSVTAQGGDGGIGVKKYCGGFGGLGRVRVEAEILHGTPTSEQAAVTAVLKKRTFIDHSLPGRNKINVKSTRFGDEVYRGCFEDTPADQLFSFKMSTEEYNLQHMTPEWCIRLCRSEGHRFSGTKPPNLCFCDNHLDMSKKKDDAQCNSPCAGNSMMTCGGTDRIQVFGPPPGTPAIVHAGVQQKCEPWCITGTQSPQSWGQCDSRETTTTSYRIHCQCPSGFHGPQCNQHCTPGTYGPDCKFNCPCNMTTTAFCDKDTGACTCLMGYQGRQCQDPCPPGKYGVGCKLDCECSSHTECDNKIGACYCKNGFTGPTCDRPCPQGFFGRNCSEPCHCTEHGSCNPVDGVCVCDPGWTEELCGEPCDPYTFGVDCTLSCDCNNSPCDSVTGECNCNAGRTGSKCQEDCPYQKYGEGCHQFCGCPQGCDPVTGDCTCPPGFFGIHCEFPCTNGAYGKNCQSRCQCVMNQTASCDNRYGFCTCKDGFVGSRCEHPCPIGFYGASCNKTCPLCQHSAPCNPTSGNCICPPGWSGQNCEVPCPSGFYGPNCGQRCPICNPGVCDPTTGRCICQDKTSLCKCPSGYHGDSCQNTCQCVHGYCGLNGSCVCDKGWKGTLCNTPCLNPDASGSPGALSCTPACPNCIHGRCHFNEDVCLCDAGFYGRNCDQNCKALEYGPDCIYQCDQCVHSNSCDSITGQCHCLPGYSGDFCTEPCPKGFYGNQCQQVCRCLNGGDCDTINGTCICPAGFMGTDCSQKCPLGKYGSACFLNCTCGAFSKGCNALTGKCICLPGYAGDECQKSCPSLAYGANCERSCRDVCDVRGMLNCNPVNGSCECRPGYTGPRCDQNCPSGTWGISCSQTCLCGSNGDCDRETGVCVCDPGYNGTYCNQVCGEGYWGSQCSSVCNCGGATCNPVTGVCMCPPGKIGHHCEQECGEAYFGFQCAQVCGCQHGGVCNKVSGECQCPPGWSGNLCEKSCPEGTYGAGCSSQCPGCRNDGVCDSVTGQCKCTPGFIGDICDQSCTPGSWGVNCQSDCPSTCRQSCLPNNGHCPCLAGACLNGGTCHQGRCICKPGFFGDDCSQTLYGTPAAQKSTNEAPAAVTLTAGEVAGVVVCILVLIVLVAMLTIFIMRRKYRNRGNSVTMNFSRSLQHDDDNGLHGFSNPHYDHPKSDNEAASSVDRKSSDTPSVEGTAA
nr:uncharacterized protein LOC105332975 isoform X2 [Crassostrea gigas]